MIINQKIFDAAWELHANDEEPEVGQRGRRVVDIVDRLAAAKLVGRRIERGVDAIVRALLPVARPGTAGAGALFVRRREREGPERRAVGDAGRGKLSAARRRWSHARNDRRYGDEGGASEADVHGVPGLAPPAVRPGAAFMCSCR